MTLPRLVSYTENEGCRLSPSLSGLSQAHSLIKKICLTRQLVMQIIVDYTGESVHMQW
jgi:hypothetical protein